jgi:hypothetical protein
MKNKYQNFNSRDEVEILSSQLSPEEMYIVGFLKGFDRRVLKEWQQKELLDFSVPVI